jgi:predicted dehydrogenase
VCYVSRFFPHVQDAHKRLQEGSFGKIIHVSADVYWNRNNEYYTQAPWRGTWEKDGGTLMNQCTHSIDLAAWFLNSPPESVYGVTRRYLRPIEAEDFGTAIIQCENGAVGTVKGTVDVFPKNLYTEFHIIGGKGTVVFEGTHMDKVRTWLFEGEEWYEPSEDNRLTGHAAVYADLIEALRSDREPLINGEEGKKSLDIVLGIYKSMKEKAIVDFPIDFSLQKMKGVI